MGPRPFGQLVEATGPDRPAWLARAVTACAAAALHRVPPLVERE